MEGTLRCTLGSKAQHAHSLETIHCLSNIAPPLTLNTSITFSNKEQQHPNTLRIVSPNTSQTLSNTQHTRQTDTPTEKRTKYKDIT